MEKTLASHLNPKKSSLLIRPWLLTKCFQITIFALRLCRTSLISKKSQASPTTKDRPKSQNRNYQWLWNQLKRKLKRSSMTEICFVVLILLKDLPKQHMSISSTWLTETIICTQAWIIPKAALKNKNKSLPPQPWKTVLVRKSIVSIRKHSRILMITRHNRLKSCLITSRDKQVQISRVSKLKFSTQSTTFRWVLTANKYTITSVTTK